MQAPLSYPKDGHGYFTLVPDQHEDPKGESLDGPFEVDPPHSRIFTRNLKADIFKSTGNSSTKRLLLGAM